MKANDEEIQKILEQLLEIEKKADPELTNRMQRTLCHWLLVTQVMVLVTALGTAIGGLFKETFPWPGTLVGLVVGWPVAQVYVYLLKRKR